MPNRYRQEKTTRPPNAFGSEMADLERRAQLVQEAGNVSEHTDAGPEHAAWCAGPAAHVPGPIVVEGEQAVQAASRVALRSALKLEVLGMRKRGTSARAIANEVMGTNIRTARKTYDAYDAWLTERFPFLPSRPLPSQERHD